MCGIAGFISNHPQPAAPIQQMNDLVRHRGPDDEGFVMFRDLATAPLVAGGSDTPEPSWRAEAPYAPNKRIEQVADIPVQIAFGHRRLSIIDLSPFGHQPLCYLNGRYWITYNGEIYNFIELRVELESLGHRFLSQSDTEVILAAYAQWGSDCLHRFNGMWAFAICDTQQQEVFLARDRFGVKPLYYWVAPGGAFCFASEIKQFTAFPRWSARVSPQRAYDFLVWGLTDHTDETLFGGVYQLQAGYFIKLKVAGWSADETGKLPVQKWYDLTPADFSGSFDDAAVELKKLLKDSVRLRLRADVPVGSCLSGGLDSSSIVCLMNLLLNEQGAAARQKTFSACADVKRFDERDWIDEVVRATGVDAHYVYPSLQSLFQESSSITWRQDEPFGSTSIYAQWCVFRLAAENGVKVMLDGQGADELLAGYDGFFTARFADLLLKGKWLRLWREICATENIHGRSKSRSLSTAAGALLPSSIRIFLRKLLRNNDVDPQWLNLLTLGAIAVNPIDNLSDYAISIQSLSYSQLTATNVQMLLHWEDRNSMAHSVESRVPFLDYRLVEFGLGLPEAFKLSDGITKRVLREGMSGVLPDRIRNRMDKLGFVTPEEVWIKERARDLFRAKLQKAVDSSQGILSVKSIDAFDEMTEGQTPFGFLFWRMINFGEWMEAFSVTK
jgi:asparagine synthase (glutamine-hydrolysing)